VKRGRPRKYDDTIPAHIDQRKIPDGVYWDARDRIWYNRLSQPRRLAGPKASLADLHRLIELRRNGDAGTIRSLHAKFCGSDVWKHLSKSTQDDYDYCLQVLERQKTRHGQPVAALEVDRLSRVLIQRLVSLIGAEHPSKAAHVLRYLRRLIKWGMQHGECAERENPAAAVDAPKELRAPTIPDKATMRGYITFLRAHGAIQTRRKGSLPPYLWALTEIAYRCRLRGVEVVNLTDDLETKEGLRTERRKGSRDNIVAWCPELREAWDALHEWRREVWARIPGFVIPIQASRRVLVVNQAGQPLQREALKSAWDRGVRLALAEGVLQKRFGMHAMKHRGVSDTAGTRDVKQQASGHKEARMLDVYDHELPLVKPAGID